MTSGRPVLVPEDELLVAMTVVSVPEHSGAGNRNGT